MGWHWTKPHYPEVTHVPRYMYPNGGDLRHPRNRRELIISPSPMAAVLGSRGGLPPDAKFFKDNSGSSDSVSAKKLQELLSLSPTAKKLCLTERRAAPQKLFDNSLQVCTPAWSPPHSCSRCLAPLAMAWKLTCPRPNLPAGSSPSLPSTGLRKTARRRHPLPRPGHRPPRAGRRARRPPRQLIRCDASRLAARRRRASGPPGLASRSRSL